MLKKGLALLLIVVALYFVFIFAMAEVPVEIEAVEVAYTEADPVEAVDQALQRWDNCNNERREFKLTTECDFEVDYSGEEAVVCEGVRIEWCVKTTDRSWNLHYLLHLALEDIDMRALAESPVSMLIGADGQVTLYIDALYDEATKVYATSDGEHYYIYNSNQRYITADDTDLTLWDYEVLLDEIGLPSGVLNLGEVFN